MSGFKDILLAPLKILGIGGGGNAPPPPAPPAPTPVREDPAVQEAAMAEAARNRRLRGRGATLLYGAAAPDPVGASGVSGATLLGR